MSEYEFGIGKRGRPSGRANAELNRRVEVALKARDSLATRETDLLCGRCHTLVYAYHPKNWSMEDIVARVNQEYPILNGFCTHPNFGTIDLTRR